MGTISQQGTVSLVYGSETLKAVAGASFRPFKIAYETSSGMLVSDASAVASSSRSLWFTPVSIASGNQGLWYRYGRFETTGLTEGIQYLDPDNSGDFTSTRPSGSGDIVRICGYAISPTLFEFYPDHSWVELI